MPPFIDFKALKERFTVADALEHYGYLHLMSETPTGHLKGPCPIHAKDYLGTSFKVSPTRRGFHCFGCKAKGNVLSLVATLEDVNVHQAAHLISEWLDGSPAPASADREVDEATADNLNGSSCEPMGLRCQFLIPFFAERDREELVVVFLDAELRITGLTSIAIESLHDAMEEPAKVFKPALLADAYGVVLAHKHRAASLELSQEDIARIQSLVAYGSLLRIPVTDHLVVMRDRYVSLVGQGLIKT